VEFYRLKMAAGFAASCDFLSCCDRSRFGQGDVDCEGDRPQWMFEPIGNGTYRIKLAESMNAPRSCLTCSSGCNRLGLSSLENRSRQQWRLEHLGQGNYRIKLAEGVPDSRLSLSCTSDGSNSLFGKECVNCGKGRFRDF